MSIDAIKAYQTMDLYLPPTSHRCKLRDSPSHKSDVIYQYRGTYIIEPSIILLTISRAFSSSSSNTTSGV